jgi:hypothetical protein
LIFGGVGLGKPTLPMQWGWDKRQISWENCFIHFCCFHTTIYWLG